MANYLQDGNTLYYVNETDKDIKYKDIIAGEAHIVVSASDIPKDGGMGAVYSEGVFEAPAERVAIKFLENVYYNSTKGTITNVAAGNIPAGYCAVPKSADTDVCIFKLASLPAVPKT